MLIELHIAAGDAGLVFFRPIVRKLPSLAVVADFRLDRSEPIDIRLMGDEREAIAERDAIRSFSFGVGDGESGGSDPKHFRPA